MPGRAPARFRDAGYRSGVFVPTLLGVLLLGAPVVPTAGPSAWQRQVDPYVLRWPDSPEHPRPLEGRTEVGLLYTPEVLRALTARHPPEAVPPRIALAIREGTPVVVLWEFADGPHDAPRPERPYHVRIAERGPWEVGAVAPIWSQQDAVGLQELDSRISAAVLRPGSGVGVGVMAAFPRDAFVPGRVVYFHSQPIRTEIGSWTYSARYAAIEPHLAQALAR